MRKIVLIIIYALTLSCGSKKSDIETSSYYVLIKKSGEFTISNEINKNDFASIAIKLHKETKFKKSKGNIKSEEFLFLLNQLEDKNIKILLDIHLPCKCKDGMGNEFFSELCGNRCLPSESARRFMERFPRYANQACCPLIEKVMINNSDKMFYH